MTETDSGENTHLNLIVILKMEEARSSETLEQTNTICYKNPKDHHLKLYSFLLSDDFTKLIPCECQPRWTGLDWTQGSRVRSRPRSMDF
jgi:hypothetical protein